MSESTEWTSEGTEWGDDLEIKVMFSSRETKEARDPEDDEILKDYAEDVAKSNQISSIGVKYNGDMVAQNSDLVDLKVKDLEGTLSIGQHDALA